MENGGTLTFSGHLDSVGLEDEPHSVLLLEMMSTGRPILLAIMKVWVWRRRMGLCGLFEGQG